jgi:cell wall-associated NlpC family hydrolase
MTHWAFDYIGKPWVVASDGPDAYDCWGLVVAVQRRLYGHDLSIIPVAENDMKT